MKRIILMCIVMMLALSGLANAEIKKEKDDTGLEVSSIIQEQQAGKFTMKFTKNIIGNEIFYRLSVTTETKFPEWLLADRPITLDIDKYPTFYLDKYHYAVARGYSKIEAELSQEMINRIANSKSLILLCDDKDSVGYIMTTNQFLPEWKQVIATEG